MYSEVPACSGSHAISGLAVRLDSFRLEGGVDRRHVGLLTMHASFRVAHDERRRVLCILDTAGSELMYLAFVMSQSYSL
jgi:hypothetical protein